MSGSASPLTPTYRGIVHSTKEALVLFEACLSGQLSHVPRRPHDRERTQLIQSGNIFIYEEHASGIKRWTDGINWSPSRILGNFLVYRELDNKIAPGEKKRALKNKSPTKPNSNGGITKHSHRSSTSSYNTDHWAQQPSPEPPETPDDPNLGVDERDPLRQLVGSLTDSYDFKEPDGLVKKTISVKVKGITHHLVNYYSVNHAMSGALKRPWNDPMFFGVHIRPVLYDQPTFRVPLGPDCYDEAGNGYISNVVGAPTPFGRMQHIPGQAVPGPGGQLPPLQVQNTSFDSFGQQLGQLPGQFDSQLGGGGYNSYSTHVPPNFQSHSSFGGNFESSFGASPGHGHAFKVEPNNTNDRHNFPDNVYGPVQPSLHNGEPGFMEDQFADYGAL